MDTTQLPGFRNKTSFLSFKSGLGSAIPLVASLIIYGLMLANNIAYPTLDGYFVALLCLVIPIGLGTGFIALNYGIASLIEVRQSHEAGKGFSIMGISLGFLGVALAVWFLATFLESLNHL